MGLRSVFPWATHRLPWVAHGLPWGPHGALTVLSHGAPVGISWGPMGVPRNAVKNIPGKKCQYCTSRAYSRKWRRRSALETNGVVYTLIGLLGLTIGFV